MKEFSWNYMLFIASRFVQRSPVSFLQSPMCKPLLCCAIAACSLDHKDANASVMKFLADFIKCAREKEVRLLSLSTFFSCFPVPLTFLHIPFIFLSCIFYFSNHFLSFLRKWVLIYNFFNFVYLKFESIMERISYLHSKTYIMFLFSTRKFLSLLKIVIDAVLVIYKVSVSCLEQWRKSWQKSKHNGHTNSLYAFQQACNFLKSQTKWHIASCCSSQKNIKPQFKLYHLGLVQQYTLNMVTSWLCA